MTDTTAEYEAVIGLEVHAQLRTRTKAFCSCPATYGSEPNTNTCPVCLGHPGALPVPNRRMVDMVLLLGLATGCSITRDTGFARKHYFYPDLPKGYQISQFDDPLCRGGHVDIALDDGTAKRIGITRIHMEEDAGKSIHDIATGTLLDFNRCGVPLAEIVSEPDLRTPAEAHAYLTVLKQIVTYLGICDGNMEEGSLRCDANVSVRRRGDAAFGTKTEVKNMNSFRNVERALAFEIERQTAVLRQGGRIRQDTLLWDAGKNEAVPMRSKEFAHDYRYFPEPDLARIAIDDAWIERIRAEIPELPAARRERFLAEYGLPAYDAGLLTLEKPLADYFEQTVRALRAASPDRYKAASNWIMGDVLRLLRERRRALPDAPVPPDALAELLDLVADGTISGTTAKDVLEETADSGVAPREIVARRGYAQVSDAALLDALVDDVLAANPESIRKYFSGRENVFGFFVGQVMKATRGQANPGLVNELLSKKLEALRRGHPPA